MKIYTIQGKPTGVVHVQSLAIEICPAQSRYAGTFEKYAVRYNAEEALHTANTLGQVCKSCRKELEAGINGTPAQSAISLGGDLPSLEEIATEAPLFPVPVIPVFICLVSADMARTWCDQATASVKSTIDMNDATCPSCVGLVQAELAGAPDATGALDSAIRTREEWLIKAVEMLSKIFEAQGFKVPPVRISVGWPGAKSRKGLHSTVGQCWNAVSAKDGVQQIFISPILNDPAEILATIMHELVHAVDGCKSDHKAGFKRIAVLVGLEGKMTATRAGATLLAVFPKVLEALGKYDHAALDPGMPVGRVQTNKHLKIVCAVCPYQSRTTRKQIDDHGISQHCGEDMEEA